MANPNKAQVSDFLKFKLTQFFRLRGIEIPSDAKAQAALVATVPAETKKQWAGEFIQATA